MVYLVFANRYTGIPLINGALADASPSLTLLNKHYFRVKLTTPFTDAFVSNSKAGLLSYKTPPSKSFCIYNGVDFNRFNNLKQSQTIESELLGKPKGELMVIAMIASFDSRKDYKTVINAAKLLCQENETYVFLLIGGGTDLTKIKNLVPKEILDKQVIFTGKRNDIESILQIVDICILMTNESKHAEGISNAIIEYMSMGKPVIASAGGGTDEIVTHRVTGLLVKPGDTGELVKSIKKLAGSEHLRSKLGENAYHFSRYNFDIHKKTQEYVDLYKKLLQSRIVTAES